jgi:hypothetical protein
VFYRSDGLPLHRRPHSACGRFRPDQRFGERAVREAAARANGSRDAGNVLRFCHWRQIERVIATLASEEVRGTIH